MGNQNESVLKIILDEGTRPVVESLKDKDTSLFRELYDKTFLSIEQYLSSVGYEKGVEKDDSNAVDKKERIVKTDNPNNIIAFLGERGSGKTSCMLSVAQMLQDKSNDSSILIKKNEKESEVKEDSQKKIKDKESLDILNATRFVHVETIEPSFIDEKANVLELVIAKLFKTFKEKVEKDTQNIKANLKHKLIEHFQKVQKDLQYCKNGNTELDTIDSLLKLSSNADLKQHLQELIDTYLKFVTNDSNENKILLLAIDDIDLNTQYAYAMVEQIRKYLILPNLLILVSLKLDQLEQVLRNEFIKQFEKSLNYPKENNPLVSDIQQMAERYIQKLIPLEHRIFMPDMEAAMDKPYVVCKTKEEAQGMSAKDCEIYRNDGSKVLKHQILASIFEKTRFLFYNTKGKASYIIPRNLREFCNLASMLYNLPDYNNSEEDTIGNCYNKTIFKKYFYGTWCENNLSVEKNVLFREIISVQDAVDINITVLKVLTKLLSKEVLKELQSADEYKYILSEKNYKWNISLGDVMAILNYYESHSVSLDDLKFVFAVKTHYSIKLYEYYNELTSNPIQKLYSNQESSNEDDSTKQIIRKDNMFGHSNYAKLVGGSFIHSGISKLLPDKSEKAIVSRNKRWVNYSIILNIIKEIQQFQQSMHGGLQPQSNLLFAIRRKIQLVEFFLMLSSRRYDTRNSSKLNDYREIKDIWYSADLSKIQKNLWFDISSCFFNCLNISETYQRFSPVFLESLKEIDKIDEDNVNSCKSLYSQIKQRSCDGRSGYCSDHSVYSQMSIRNIEVLEDLVSEISKKSYKDGADIVVYEEYFSLLSKYSINVYRHINGCYDMIDFHPYKVISDWLNSIQNDEQISNIFESVMSVQEGLELGFQYDCKRFKLKKINRKSTIIKNLKQQNPNFPDRTKLVEILEKKFTESHYDRAQIEEICTQIAQELTSQN